MVTSVDLQGTLGVDWSPLQTGLDDALGYAQAWAPKANAALQLAVTVDTSALTNANSAFQGLASAQAAMAQSAGPAASGLSGIAASATAAGTGVTGLGNAQQDATSKGQALYAALGQVNSAQGQTAATGQQAASALGAVSGQAQGTGAGLAVATRGHQQQSAAARDSSLSLGGLEQTMLRLAGTAVPGLNTALTATTGVLTSTQRGIQSLTDDESSLLQTTTLLGGGLTAAGLAAAGGFFAVFDSGLTTLRNLSEISGLTIPQVAGLQAVFQSVGIPAQTATMTFRQFSTSLETMQQQLDAGKEPTGRQADALRELGISAVGANGQIQPISALLPAIMDRFAALSTSTDQAGQGLNLAGLAGELFGSRVGAQLLPALERGSGAWDDFTQKAQAAGIGSDDQVAKLDRLQQTSATTGIELKGMALAIGSDVAPAFTTGIQLAGDLASAYGKLPAPLRDLIITVPLAAGGTMLLAAGLSQVISLGGTAISSLGALATAFTSETAAAEASAVATEAAAAAATTSLIPGLGLIVGVAVAAGVAVDAWVSSNDSGAESARKTAAAIDAETKSVQDHIDKLRQAGSSDQQIYSGMQDDAATYTAGLQRVGTQLTTLNQQLGQQAAQQVQEGAGLSGLTREQVQNNSFLAASYYDVLKGLQAQSPEYQQLEAQYDATATKLRGLDPQLASLSQNLAAGTQAAKDHQTQVDKDAASLGLANLQIDASKQAHTDLVAAMEREAQSTASAATVQTQYQGAVAASALSTDDYAKRRKVLDDVIKGGTADQQELAREQLAMDTVVKTMGADFVGAALNVQGLTTAAGVQSSTLADNAGHVKDIQSAIDSEKDSSQQAAVVQQQLSQARQFAAQSGDQQASSLAALQLLIDMSTGSTKAYYEEQQKLDLAYQALGPDAANLAAQHQQLADAFGITKDKTVDLSSQLPDLIQAYRDGTISATDFGNAINGIFSKPDQAELEYKARLADIKDALSGLNSELANSSYAERHIAELEKIVLQDQATGASSSKLAQDQANLGTAMAGVSPQAASQGKALADQVFQLTNQRDAVQASLDKEVAHRESMGATVTAQQALATGTALSTSQMVGAYQTYESGVTGTLTTVHDTAVTHGTTTGRDTTTALTTSFAAGNPAILAAGGQNAASYDRGLIAGMDITKTDATNAAAQLAGAITMPDAFAAAGTTDGEAFGSAIVAAIDAAMRTAAQHVQAGGATIAGLASAAGTAGSRSTAGAGFNLTAGAGGFFYPTEGPITQGFGENGEKGIDIGVSPGTPLASGIAGKIVDVKAPSPEQAAAGLGYWVTIDAGNGLQEVIGHMDDIAVQLGDTVKQGQVIGVSGGEFQPGHEDTSISSGPHTEVQVLVNGGLVNPESVLGKVLQAAPGATTDGGTVAVNVAPSVGGHLLTPEQYAAIQAHESTLPLPSPGNPEPMFGLTNGAAGDFAVGQQVFTSGGTAAASESMGLAPGQTRADLLPSVDAGESAFDALIQKIDPGAVATLQQQGFAAFMNRIAPWYAGPGEAPGFAADVIANAQAGVGTPGLTGELPGAAPDMTLKQQASFQATQTRDAGAAAADVTGAQNQLDQLQSRLDDLTSSQIPAAYQQQAQAAVGSAQTAITAQQAVLAAAQTVQSDITSNVDDNTLKQDEAALASAKTQAGAAGSAANSANSAWTKTSGEVTASLQAVQTEGEKSSAALSTLSQHNADVAAGQTDYPTKIGAAYQQSATTAVTAWTQVGTDIDALNTALANGADAATLKSLHARLTSDTQSADSADKAASASFAAWDKEYKAEAQARKDLDTAIRADVTNEVNLTATLATAWTKVGTSIEEVSQRLGPDFAVGSGMIVDLAHSSATAAAAAYHSAQATVIQDEQALTGELSEQDRQRLTSKTSTDKDIAASALQSAQDQQKAFGLVADAFNAMNTNLAAAAKNRLGMDAAGYDAWTDQVLTSVGITTDATTRGEEAKLTAARTTYDAVVADSAAASQQLIKDQNDYNNAVARGDTVMASQAQTAVSADQTRISSDQAAATAIVQQYGTIQSAVDAAMKTQIDDAKTAAQAEITSLSAVRDAALQGIADRKTALDALVQKEQQALSDTATTAKDAIDTRTETQIAGIQSQLDAEQKLKDQQQLTADTTAVATAKTAAERANAERTLADFQIQLHDKVLQSQIKALQDAATDEKKHLDEQTSLQKQALTDQTTAQKTALDTQATALRNLYDDPKTGLISVQKAAITALDAANSAHYTKQEGDAVADANKLLAITSQSAHDQATAIATAAGSVLATVGGLATSPITVQPSSAALTATTANTTALTQLTHALGTSTPAAGAATASEPLVRPQGQDQTAPTPGTQDLSAEGRSFTQALVHGLGAFTMETMHDPSSQQRLAGLADAEGAAFGLAPGWWSHGVPTFGGGFGYRTQAQVQASIQDVAPPGTASDWHMVLAAIQYLQAHPDLWLDNKTEFGVGPESAGGDKWATMLKAFNDYALEMKTKGGITVPMPAELMQHNVEEMTAEYGQNVLKPFWFFGQPGAAGQSGGAALAPSDAALAPSDAANTTATVANTTAVTANTTAVTTLRAGWGGTVTGTPVAGETASTAANTTALQTNTAAVLQTGHWVGNTWTPDAVAAAVGKATATTTAAVTAATVSTTTANTAALQANTAAVVQTGHWVGNTWTPDAIATALKSTTLPVTVSGPAAEALATVAAQAPLQTAQLTTVGQAQGPQGTHLDAIAQSSGSTAASAGRWLEGIWGNGTQAFMVQSQMLHAFTTSPGAFVQMAQANGAGQGASASGLTVNVPITLNATQGGTPEQIANEVAKQVHDQVLAELNDLFGRGATLAGA